MATNLCDSLLAVDIQGYNCDNPMVKGLEHIGLLINRSQIQLDSVTRNSTDKHMITALPLATGATAYKIVQSGKTPFSGTQQELVEGTYQNTFTNTVQFAILNYGLITAEAVDELMNGTFVAIVTNKYAPDADTAHQVIGLEAGLRASAMVREWYNDDTLAGWLVTLTEEGAPSATSYIGDTLYDSLANPSS